MSLKTRKILFYSLVFLFLTVGGVIVLYSRGTIIDLENLRLVQTGGIYLESDPPDTTIELDGQPIKNTVGLLQAGTFINNLAPVKYRVVLKKEGYYDWRKEAYVLPNAVAVFDRIIMVPSGPAKKLTDAKQDFYVSGNKLIFKDNNRLVAEEKTLSGNEVVQVLPNGSVLTLDDKTGNYYLANLFAPSSSLNLTLTFNNLKESVLKLPGVVLIQKIYPYADRKFLVRTSKALYSLDVDRLNLEIITTTGKTTFSVGKSQVFWSEGNELWSYNLPLRLKVKLADLFIKSRVAEMAVSSDDNLIAILETSGQLTLFDKRDGGAKAITDKAKLFTFSYNSRLLAFADNDGSLHIYDLDKGKYIDINSGLKNVTEVSWYGDNRHLFAEDSGNLFFLEVDDRKPQNSYKLAEDVTKFIYDRSNNLLYFMKAGGLFSLEI